MSDIVITPAGASPAGTGAAGAAGDARAHGRVDQPQAPRDGQRRGMDPFFGVRTADIEPYTGLRYLSKLFRMIAVVLVLLLIAEVIWGIKQDGVAALSTLLAEVSRLVVLAGLLWGVGDLAILLIDVGHDVRAARILIGRQTAHLAQHAHEGQVVGPPVMAAPPASSAAVATGTADAFGVTAAATVAR